MFVVDLDELGEHEDLRACCGVDARKQTAIEGRIQRDLALLANVSEGAGGA